MKHVEVDFSKVTGRIKPMHAVNNGPIKGTRGNGNMQAFTDAGIPCCRNHDASFSMSYGGSHAHDVLNIFPNFDADENDPANYDFVLTDRTCMNIYECGSTMMFRLGSKIEHEIKKYQTLPPKDFAKYARICEHIIRHYCYGWADGPCLPIEYWEIWNEPDCNNQACWGGTHEEFLEFYEIMAKHLKGCFPELKIGGPAYTGALNRRHRMEAFVEYASEHQIPLDFFSWHGYRTNPHDYAENVAFAKELLLKYGFTQTETILNEWNYVRGWTGDDIKYSYRTNHNEKGAAFCAASMLTVQKTPLDMFMYYDARPGTAWNGLFELGTYDPYKPYYAFWQFNKLYQLKNEVASATDSEEVYVGAAKDGEKAAVQLVYYAEEDLEAEDVEVCLKGLQGTSGITVTLIDREHDNQMVRREVCSGQEVTLFLKLQQHSTVLLENYLI